MKRFFSRDLLVLLALSALATIVARQPQEAPVSPVPSCSSADNGAAQPALQRFPGMTVNGVGLGMTRAQVRSKFERYKGDEVNESYCTGREPSCVTGFGTYTVVTYDDNGRAIGVNGANLELFGSPIAVENQWPAQTPAHAIVDSLGAPNRIDGASRYYDAYGLEVIGGYPGEQWFHLDAQRNAATPDVTHT